MEVASAVARATNDSEQGLTLAQAIRLWPGQIWVPLDNLLAKDACRIGAERRLRSADAVYAAVALRHGTTLVTLDQQQLDRLGSVLKVRRPVEVPNGLNKTVG